MKIKTVKLYDEAVALDWSGEVDGATINHSLRSGPEPGPAFYNAVSDLKDDVQDLMEITSAKWMDTVRVVGVTLSYDDDGAASFSIAFRKKFRSGRVVGYSTPLLRQRTDHTETGSSFASEDLWAKIRTVLKEAERYLGGHKAQTDVGDAQEA